MNMENIRAVAFDMDGTLLDSMGYWRGENRHFLQRRSLPIPEDLKDTIDTMSSHAFARRFVADYGAPNTFESVMDEYHEVLRGLYRTVIPAKPGAERFLRLLKKHGVKMCVATATLRDTAVAALDKQGFLPYFEFVTDGTDMGLAKGDPRYFEKLAERLGEKPENCAMFEDSAYAMKSARAAGMKILGIRENVYADKPDEMARILENCDLFVDTFDEAADKLFPGEK